jgi:aspartate 1-decarboxylase
MCLNGACARLRAVGDKIIAPTFAQMTPEEADSHCPVVVHVDERNRIVEGGDAPFAEEELLAGMESQVC